MGLVRELFPKRSGTSRLTCNSINITSAAGNLVNQGKIIIDYTELHENYPHALINWGTLINEASDNYPTNSGIIEIENFLPSSQGSYNGIQNNGNFYNISGQIKVKAPNHAIISFDSNGGTFFNFGTLIIEGAGVDGIKLKENTTFINGGLLEMHNVNFNGIHIEGGEFKNNGPGTVRMGFDPDDTVPLAKGIQLRDNYEGSFTNRGLIEIIKTQQDAIVINHADVNNLSTG